MAVGPFMRCMYSSDDPVVGSRTELIVWVEYWDAMMFAAIEYLDNACGWSLYWKTRLTKPACRRLCCVGYLCCVWM